MPHKFNTARRHKFDKAQYRVINWAEYNESLRQRGDLTIWVSEEAQSVWSAPRRTSQGGQRRYSDLAIETCQNLLRSNTTPPQETLEIRPQSGPADDSRPFTWRQPKRATNSFDWKSQDTGCYTGRAWQQSNSS